MDQSKNRKAVGWQENGGKNSSEYCLEGKAYGSWSTWRAASDYAESKGSTMGDRMDNAGVDRLAVLIDADNASAKAIDSLLAEVARYGTATAKRAYGDWTTTNLNSWKPVLHRHAILPIQQFSYTTGKNATDCAMIIDAMDLLYSRNFTGFCLVSSDSDFTRLATRLRQDGQTVYGFGERKTPKAFVNACDKFVYLEVLSESLKPEPASSGVSSDKRAKLNSVVCAAMEMVSSDDGWAPLSMVGDHISRNHPSFDSRNYGFKKLGELMEYLETVDIRHVEKGGGKHMYVRLKPEQT
jgi:hypothetical protein